MSNIPITNLPQAVSITGSEEIPAVQSNSSVRVTAQQIADLNTNTGTVTQIDTTAPITGGPITTSGTIALASQGVTNAYLALMPAYTLKGNDTGASAVAQDLTATQALGVLGIGSIANNTLLGNVSGSTANPTANTLSSYIDSAISSTQGSLLYRNASSWVALAPDTVGKVLSTNGTGANPSWLTIAGTGTVTSVGTGTGLTGGPVTTTGTISIANTAVTAGTYGTASQVPTYQVNAQGQLTSASNTAIAIDASAITTGVLPIARGGTANASTPLDGQLLIGNGTGYSLNTISAGAGVTVANSAGGISVGLTNTAVSSGSYGSSSSVSTFTVNSQGQLTAAASVPINAVALTTGTISTLPSSSIDIVNKEYVDSVAQGLNFHAACNYASTTSNVYTVTYYNGPANNGVGATLTNAGANAAFAIDSVTMTSGNLTQRMLIKNQADAAQNGVYTLTVVGDGSTAWVLTRATDYDTSGTGTNEIDAGDFMYVLSGSTLANTSWVQQTPLPIIVGTTSIVFTQFGAQTAYTNGTGLSLIGNQFSITNTAVTANSYGSASSVPTFTVNAQGQLTAASNTSIAIDAAAITTGQVAISRGGTALGTTPTSGQLLIGNGTGYTLGTITQGTGIGVTNGAGSIAVKLNDTAVTAASYGSASSVPTFTVNAQGQLTAASNTSIAIDASAITAGTLTVSRGGTGLSTLTAGYIPFGAGTSAFGSSANLFWDSANSRLGVGTVFPTYSLDVYKSAAAVQRVYSDTSATSIIANYSTDTVGGVAAFYKYRGTNVAPTTVVSGDIASRIISYGYDGTSLGQVAEIRSNLDGTVSTGSTPGRLVFYTTTSGSATVTERMRIDSSGNVIVTGVGGLGYGTGSGGAVTQLTSRTTGVTLNKTNGAITMFSAAGSATAATFTVTNSTIAATDTINLSQKSGTNLYVFLVTAIAAGSFNVTFYTTGGTATDAPVINFAVVKGVTA